MNILLKDSIRVHSSPDSISNTNWDFIESVTKGTIHSIHPYPARFIPEIPRALIKILGIKKNTGILDPFCGSGVTLVEAQNSNIPSIGIDLNPIACLISIAKTTKLPDGFLEKAHIVVVKAQKERNVVAPQIPNLDHWYKKEIQLTLTSLLQAINSVRNPELEDFLKLALSSILVKVSNQESDTRYAAIHKNITGETVFDFFLSSCTKINKLCKSMPSDVSTTVLNKDIMTVTKKDIKFKIGLVVTSPPYPNAYEYWLYHKYRMWWLGYDPVAVKKSEIGARAHYFKKNHHTAEDFSKNMLYTFNLLREVMVEGGFACFVIGRSKIHGQIINNAEIIERAAQCNGFKFIESVDRELRSSRKSFNLSHANIKREEILIFKKG